MSRGSFDRLLDLIKNHPVFGDPDRKSNGRRCHPHNELLVLLSYLGQQIGSGSKTRNTFFIGYGTHFLYCNRVVEAICSLRDRVVFWPDEEERRIISERMKKKYDFPNCLGTGDGTLFPLASSPRTGDAADYNGRKFKYTITCFIINDDKRRIRSYIAGWPGSVHDNRVFGQMSVDKKHKEHFGPCEYILSDSALENCDYVVSAFKKPPLQPIPIRNERFNTKLARARILAEHTIGILKGRFPWLKTINMIVTEEKKSMVRILKYIDCCVIIHNLLIESNEHNPDQEEWIDAEDVSDVDDENRIPTQNDLLYRPIPRGRRNDERRSRLQTYFENKEYVH